MAQQSTLQRERQGRNQTVAVQPGRRAVCVLTLMIATLSSVAALTGVLTAGGPGTHQVTLRGASVTLYGEGLAVSRDQPYPNRQAATVTNGTSTQGGTVGRRRRLLIEGETELELGAPCCSSITPACPSPCLRGPGCPTDRRAVVPHLFPA